MQFFLYSMAACKMQSPNAGRLNVQYFSEYFLRLDGSSGSWPSHCSGFRIAFTHYTLGMTPPD